MKPVREVNFKPEVHHLEGPVVVPDRDIPEKRDTKPDRGKRFLFFKKRKPKVWKICLKFFVKFSLKIRKVD